MGSSVGNSIGSSLMYIHRHDLLGQKNAKTAAGETPS